MFRKLRIRLTLINVVVVGLISLFFMLGIFALTANYESREMLQTMQSMATEAGAKPKSGPKVPAKRWFSYFYVKINNSGVVLETSPNISVPTEQLQSLAQKTLKSSKPTGDVHWDEAEYRFLKAPQVNEQGWIIVFANTEANRKVREHILAAFALTSLGVLVLTFGGSLFMANRALIPIQKSWQRQRDFVADASHELRTPLAVIQTNLELVLSNPGETVANQAKWLGNIQEEQQIMANLVDNLLLLARTDSQQLQLNKETFLLNSALNEALEPFRPVATQQGINLKNDLETPINFYGDRNLIKQVVVILLDNALKYTPRGGDIELKLIDQTNNIEFSVSDTGEGIDPEHLGKIFERFYRVDKARSRQGGGTGLGLAIAQWIVNEHHGEITVASTLGQGSSFRVILPKTKRVT